MTVEEMKKVLHSLRTSMTREVKRMQEDPTYVTRWKFFKDFEFVREEIVKSLSDKHEREWEDHEVETLVEFYKENNFLWNHHLTEYKDRQLKEAALNKLVAQLNGRSQDEIKQQWHSLKTIFDREDKRIEGSKRSGAGTDSVYKTGWKYFELMQFTKECKEIDDSVCTLLSTLSTNSGVNSEAHPVPKKRKKEKTQELQDTRVELLRKAIDVLKTPEPENKNTETIPGEREVNAFGQLITETLYRFSERQRVVAKKRINDVLFEVEMSGGRSLPCGFSESPAVPILQPSRSFSSTYHSPSYGRSPSPASSLSSMQSHAGSQWGDSQSY